MDDRMENINDYGVFRDKCASFSERYIEKYLSGDQLVCHPFVKDLIFAACDEEEAKRNDNTICRLRDMMLMSEDGESDWRPFKIEDARKIAEENEHLYISDLLFSERYLVHDWMIDGKHDQIVVSEQYMREHNKPYAPVTPLTNQKLKIKKFVNPDFWRQGTPENPAVISFETIQDSLDECIGSLVEKFPKASDLSERRMDLFGTAAEIGRDAVCTASIEKALDSVMELKAQFDKYQPLIAALGRHLKISAYTIKFMVAALNKNGVEINPAEFRGDYFNPAAEKLPETHTDEDEIECAKECFRKAFSEKNPGGVKLVGVNESEYSEKLRKIELSDGNADELHREWADILSAKPADRLIFRMLNANAGGSSEEVAEIEEFWFGSRKNVTDDELDAHLSESYTKDCRGEDGKLSCDLVRAGLALDDLESAVKKYRFSESKTLSELKGYISELDKANRSYNGTVFDTVDDMKKAMANELELNKLCADLTALDRNELLKLRKYICDMTADDKTKGKYLVKAKLALNDSDKNQLDQLCLGLPFMKADEAEALKKKIAEGGFDETISKPYIEKIDARLISVQAEELTAEFSKLSSMSEADIDALLKKTDTDKYSPVLKKHFIRKAEAAKDNISRSKFETLCKGMEGFDKTKLTELKKEAEKISARPAVASAYLKKIDRLINDFDRREVAEIFSGISKADEAQLAKLRGIINEGKYDSSLTDPYISAISEREKAVEIEKFTAKCDTIPKMNKDELAAIKADLVSGKYASEITDKYAGMVVAREIELEKNEIAEICKDIAAADEAALKEISKKLSDEKFKKEYTAEYFEKIKARRIELEKKEIAELCKDIKTSGKEELKKLREKLSDEKYSKDFTAEYFESIKQREIELEKKEIAELCKDIATSDKDKLKKLVAELAMDKYNKEYTTEYFDKIKARVKEIDNKEAADMCADIPKMDRAALKTLSEKLADPRFDKEYTAQFFDKIKARGVEIDKNELKDMCKNIQNMKKEELEKLTADISAKYSKEVSAEFIEKIREKEIQLMKKELENLCKNIPSMPRTELSKLKEALKGDSFDKELSAKYIAQIEQREQALIKTELQTLCKNIDSSDKEKLLEIKHKISDTPEYASEGKSYIERIDKRIQALDKEEFDKMMASIAKLDEKGIENFRKELENRKSTLSPAKYSETIRMVEQREDELEKAALEKICAGYQTFTISQIASALGKIEDEGYSHENAGPYIKKLNDAANQLHIKNLGALTENMGNLNRTQLLEVLRKVREYSNGCPEDMKRRYEGMVKSKIRQYDDKQVGEMCRNLGNMSMKEIIELIEKIKAMDIDDSSKIRYINSCDNQILSDKRAEREIYVKKLHADMSDNMLNDSHLITPDSNVFDSYFSKMSVKFAKLGKYELPILLHLGAQNSAEEGFVFGMDSVYVCNKQGLITVKTVNEIEKFNAKTVLFNRSLNMEETNGVTTELPNNLKGNSITNVARVLNLLLTNIKDYREAEKLREKEENAARIKAEEEAAMNAAAAKSSEAPVREEIKPLPPVPPVPMNDTIKPLKPVEPIEDIVKTPAAVQQNAVQPAAKPADTKPEQPAAKPADTRPQPPKPVEKKLDEKIAEKVTNIKVDITVPEIKKIDGKAPVTKPVEIKTPEIKKLDKVPEVAKVAETAKSADKPVEVKLPEIRKPEGKPAETKAPEVKKPEPAKPAEKVTEVKPAPAPESAKPIKLRFCDQCGAKIVSSTAKFCVECGNRINK